MSGHLGRIVDGLDYDFGCFDLGHFIDHIARRQRREIIVAAVDFAPKAQTSCKHCGRCSKTRAGCWSDANKRTQSPRRPSTRGPSVIHQPPQGS